MGWASGGEIFDSVAAALIEAGASDDLKGRVLGSLIEKLQDGDWDTEDESLTAFRHDPVIVAAFIKRRVGDQIESDTDAYGLIGVDDSDSCWTLTCAGSAGCGFLADRRLTVAGHDELVHAWADYEQTQHGSDGAVADWMLLGDEVTR